MVLFSPGTNYLIGWIYTALDSSFHFYNLWFFAFGSVDKAVIYEEYTEKPYIHLSDVQRPYLRHAQAVFAGVGKACGYSLTHGKLNPLTFLTIQETAITPDYQTNNDMPRKERHRANFTSQRLAYSSTLRALIAIYVPSLRQSHKGSAGSLLFWSLLFVGVTSYNHNRNFQNPYLPWRTKSISEP